MEYGFKYLVGATPRACGIIGIGELGALYEADFHLKSLVVTLAVGLVAIVAEFYGLVYELAAALGGLLAITLATFLGNFQKG